VVVLILMRMAGDQDRAARHAQKRMRVTLDSVEFPEFTCPARNQT
jgi:hypothetical protein